MFMMLNAVEVSNVALHRILGSRVAQQRCIELRARFKADEFLFSGSTGMGG